MEKSRFDLELEVGDVFMADIDEDEIAESAYDLESSDSESEHVFSDHSDDDEKVIEARKILRLRRSKDKMVHSETYEEETDNSNYDSGHNDEEEILVKRIMSTVFYAPNSNLKGMEWDVGVKFKDGKECKDAVVAWAIANGRYIKWTKCSKTKVQAECVEDCKWRLYASTISDEPTFMIKSYEPKHNCIRVKRNRQANRDWISKQMVNILKRNPNMPAKQLQYEMEERHDVLINTQVCYRARKLALERVRGSYEEDYKKLRSYVAELMKIDVEGHFLLKTSTEQPAKPLFQRIYIGFSSLKEGFLHGCRHIICFDGCFLKTTIGGTLLAAIGKDCNYQMYPISWVVVEKENEASWTWFLRNLFEHLGIDDGLGWTLMSDKQKGLINAIQEVAPNAEHRHCVRHIYENFKKKWRGPKYKELFWECVRANTPRQFEKKLANLRAESVEAWTIFVQEIQEAFVSP